MAIAETLPSCCRGAGAGATGGRGEGGGGMGAGMGGGGMGMGGALGDSPDDPADPMARKS